MEREEIKSKEINELIDKNKKYLTVAIFFTILALVFLCWSAFIYVEHDYIYKNLHESIMDRETRAGKFVKLTVTKKPYVFAEYNTNRDENKYYFLEDDNYLYIGYLDYETSKKLDNIGDEPMKIFGVTKQLSSDILDLAIKVYNEDIGREVLTKDNYKHYIGDICIDTTKSNYPYLLQLVIGIILGSIAVYYYFLYIRKTYVTNKTLEETPVVVIEKVISEIQKSNCVNQSKHNIYLAENYLIDSTNGLVIIPYSDILWVYINNKCIFRRNIVIVTKSRGRYKIAYINVFNKKGKRLLSAMFDVIKSKNRLMILGYSKENKKIVKY